MATAAGVSRALVHAYLGDRRGLIDAVQVRVIGRLDAWVGHGFGRAATRAGKLAALVHGTFAFVDAERDAWGVLVASGGLDHPAFHGVRGRWAAGLATDGDPTDPAAMAIVLAVVGGAGTWTNRGTDPTDVIRALAPLLRPTDA